MGAVCIDFDAYTGREPKGVLILDAISQFIYYVSSEDKRLKQIGSLLGMAVAAKSLYVFIVLYMSSQATNVYKAPRSRNEPNYRRLSEHSDKTVHV